IEHRNIASGRLLLHGARDSMCTEHGHGVRRHFRQVLDKSCTLGLEALDDVPIVHDLMAHIYRWSIFLQRTLDDLDGGYDASAKTSGLGKNHTHIACHPEPLTVTPPMLPILSGLTGLRLENAVP